MAQCQKYCYTDLTAAQRIAKERAQVTGDSIRAYVCESCGWSRWKISKMRSACLPFIPTPLSATAK